MNRNSLWASGMVLAVLVLWVSGCPYESEVPLTPVESARIDASLIGKWQYGSGVPNDPKGSGTITFFPFNEREFLAVLEEEGKKENELYRAFVSVVDGERFLNAQEIKASSEKRSWAFVNYEVNQGELRIRIVEEKLFKEKKGLSETPFEFIRKHLKDKDLYGEEPAQILRRTKG
jgi:hypothetical protein